MKQVIIKCVVCVIFVLVLYERAITSAKDLTTIHAKYDPDYDHLIANETPIYILSDTTRMKCAKKCVDDYYCMTYFFNVVSNMCKIFDVDFVDFANRGYYEYGWKCYRVNRDCKINGNVCPPTYTYVDTLCFCFKYFMIEADYFGAYDHCKAEGGYLAKIDRLWKHIEMEKLLLMVPEPEMPNGDIFIQGTRNETDDTWWYDNGRQMRFFVWNREHPMLYQPELRDGETAIIIQKFWWSKWHDTFTNTSRMFVCEIPL